MWNDTEWPVYIFEASLFQNNLVALERRYVAILVLLCTVVKILQRKYIRRKKEKERTRVDSGEERCHRPWIQQKDLIVAILMSIVGVIMAVLISWGQHPHNKVWQLIYIQAYVGMPQYFPQGGVFFGGLLMVCGPFQWHDCFFGPVSDCASCALLGRNSFRPLCEHPATCPGREFYAVSLTGGEEIDTMKSITSSL